MTGVEPVTSSLPMRCATTCATSARPLLNLSYRSILVNNFSYFYIKFFLIIQSQTAKIFTIGGPAVNGDPLIPFCDMKCGSLLPGFFRQSPRIIKQCACRRMSKNDGIRTGEDGIKKLPACSQKSIPVHL